jgi:peptide/nickel transport system permease protein
VRRFVAVRLLQAIVVLGLVTTITFFLIHLAPGDPFGFQDDRLTPAIRAQLRAQFGYDRPLLEQYVRYLGNVARGHLGYSHSLHMPVASAIGITLPRTLLLMSLAVVLSFAGGIALGACMVRRRGQRTERVADAVTLFVNSLPDFWLALMLLLAFAYWVPLFPAGGMIDVVLHDYMSAGASLLDRARHLVLPLLTLTIVEVAMLARYQRAALLEVMPLDFVRTARAKGVDESGVVGRHALRNALLPMITLGGLVLPTLVGGTVFVERVFAWPGMGWMVTEAIAQRDYPLVVAAVVIGGAVVAIGSLAADIAYAFADPRIRVR